MIETLKEPRTKIPGTRMHRIYLDNNFFDQRLAQLNPSDISAAFEDAGLQWCFSEELCLELLDSIKKLDNRKIELMKSWARLILELLPTSQIYRNYAHLIIEEVKGETPEVFYSSNRLTENFGQQVRVLADGVIESETKRAWTFSKKMKTSDQDFSLGLETLREQGAKDLPFEDFAFFLLKKLLCDVRTEGRPEERAKRIVASLSAFPHIRCFLYAAHKLSYERQGRRHHFDLRHLVYATDVDLFITNDEQAASLAKQIFDSKPKVLTQKGLLDRLALVPTPEFGLGVEN